MSSQEQRSDPIVNPKVAIPRQPQSGPLPGSGRRVPKACEACRQRKIKCSGDTPVCRQCRQLRVNCNYPMSFREKTKTDMDRISEKASDFEEILRELQNVVDGRASASIRQVLQKHSADTTKPPQEQPKPAETDTDESDDEESSIGSLDAIDRVDEDLNRSESTRETGYMGKNSEITWLQRMQKEAKQRYHHEPGAYDAHAERPEDADFALTSVNYHLDDMEISVPWPVQKYWVPPRQLADQLFEDYLDTVHPYFPLLSRPLFRSQYKKFFYDTPRPRPGDKWLAVLNMIFAISAKHAHLTQAPWRGNENDHLEYLTRARMLSFTGDTILNHPDLQQVQVEGLIAFYLLASNQISRCWRVASLSVRSCITLGINLKNTSENMSNMAKEARYRVWWTLYSFEHLLGIMTGRATSILDGICTSPLPFPFDEEYMSHPMATWILFNAEQRKELVEDSLACIMVHQMPSNPAGGKHAKYTDSPRDTSWLRSIPVNLALCHLYYTDLSVIAQEVVIKVYSIDCAITPWPHIENRIGELRARLDLWHANLREEFRFTEAPIERADDGLGLLRGRLFLAFYYYSTRITLGRPCLCRHDAQQPQPGSGEGRFSHQISIMTLDSSRQMLGLISDDPDPTTLYQTCPWWAVLHYLMQATTILLLELSLGCVHAPQDETKFLEAAKKGVRWFYAMSERSVASRRAWQLCDLNLRRIATGMNYDLTDMPVLPYEPKPRQPRDTTILPYMEQTVPWDMQPPLAAPDISGDSQTPIPDLSQFSLAELDSDPAADPGPSAQPPFPSSSSDSANFPYDSVTREFTRSFFPPADYQRPRDPSAEL